jgi:hypothetical protein
VAKWRCLHASIVLSRRLKTLSFHDRIVYTWGIPVVDAWGIMRRDDIKAAIFPKGGSTERRVQLAIDRLIDLKLLCAHQHEGDEYIHWCKWEKYQGELIRKGRGEPAFPFTCPNEANSALQRDGARHSASPRTTRPRPRQDKTVTTTTPPTPQNGPPPSPLFQAVMAIWPGAGATFYQGYTDLEEEYGQDFLWECWKAALQSGQTKPSVRYLDAVARRCKAEGRMPLEKQELRDERAEQGPDNRPTEVDGRPVAGWVGDEPIFFAPAKAS